MVGDALTHRPIRYLTPSLKRGARVGEQRADNGVHNVEYSLRVFDKHTDDVVVVGDELGEPMPDVGHAVVGCVETGNVTHDCCEGFCVDFTVASIVRRNMK